MRVTDEPKDPRSAAVRRPPIGANGFRCSNCPALTKSKPAVKRPCCGLHRLVRG